MHLLDLEPPACVKLAFWTYLSDLHPLSLTTRQKISLFLIVYKIWSATQSLESKHIPSDKYSLASIMHPRTPCNWLPLHGWGKEETGHVVSRLNDTSPSAAQDLEWLVTKKTPNACSLTCVDFSQDYEWARFVKGILDCGWKKSTRYTLQCTLKTSSFLSTELGLASSSTSIAQISSNFCA